MSQLANHLQVTVGSYNIILQLKDHAINMVEELDNAEILFNAESYVETGFKLINSDDSDHIYRNDQHELLC